MTLQMRLLKKRAQADKPAEAYMYQTTVRKKDMGKQNTGNKAKTKRGGEFQSQLGKGLSWRV